MFFFIWLFAWLFTVIPRSIAQNLCVNSNTLALCINTKNNQLGSITSISTSEGLNLTTTGYSWIGDNSYFNANNILSLVISSPSKNVITVTKNIAYSNECTLTLNDTYYVSPNDPTVIEWKLTVNNITTSTSSPFRTSISTQFNLTNISSNDMYYWTMQSGEYTTLRQPFEDVLKLLNGTDINKDTLYTQIGDNYVDNIIRNNAPNKAIRRVSVFPLAIFLSKSHNHGISFIYDINKDILLGGTMNINSKYQLFQRYYNRLSNKMDSLTFTTYIRLNKGFTWRDTLNWTMSKFSNLFKPSGTPSKVNDIVNNVGLGLYTCAAAQDIDTLNVVNNSGANLLWDASFWYVYQGMSLPPVSNWSSYLGPEEQGYCGQHFKHGEPSTRDIIASHYYNMSQIGIRALSYFNLFEWGEFVEWPLNISNVNITDNIWSNSSLYLSVYMNDSVLLDVNGNTIHEGPYKGIVLDPGVESWHNRIVNQTYEHIYSFGDHFYGISIDRQDWTTQFNYRRSDGYSLCNNSIECSSMLLSWKQLAVAVGNIVHNMYTKNNAIITTNYQKQRMELLEITDIIFSEQSDLTHLNSVGLSSMGMHSIEWTYSTNEVMIEYGGPHQFFQEKLYLNVHPMAPVLGADHSIPINTTVQVFYTMYGELFRVLRGTTWWLSPNTVELLSTSTKGLNDPLINSFIDNVNGDIIIILVLGYDLNENVMNIDVNVTGVSSLDGGCKTMYPGQTTWNNAVNDKTVVTLPLKYGCAVAKCMGSAKN